jgi:HK97 gp10 family phage protein
MEFSVRIEGLDRLAKSTEHFKARAKNEVEKGLYAAAKKVEGDAKKSILQGSKTGRVYKRKSVIHKASAPGEAPANDTGRLAGSISTYLNSTALESIVTAGRGLAKYATMLEFGTRKIKPRPFMFPALEKNKAWIANRLNDAMQKALKK